MMDTTEAVARALKDRRTVRRFFGRRAIDKSCYEVVHDMDPDGPISNETFKVVETGFLDDWTAFARAEELADEYCARAAIAVMPGWQPIESAPKDETNLILLWNGEKVTGGAPWGSGWADWMHDWIEPPPTHWMPLPPPPQEKPHDQ